MNTALTKDVGPNNSSFGDEETMNQRLAMISKAKVN